MLITRLSTCTDGHHIMYLLTNYLLQLTTSGLPKSSGDFHSHYYTTIRYFTVVVLQWKCIIAVLGPTPNRVGTADSAAAAAADTRCAQAKRDRSNSSPPPPSQWSPWSRVLQKTPLLCPAGRRNGSSHATLSSTVSRCGVFGKFTAPPEEGSAWPNGHGRKGNSLYI